MIKLIISYNLKNNLFSSKSHFSLIFTLRIKVIEYQMKQFENKKYKQKNPGKNRDYIDNKIVFYIILLDLQQL
jgi:hypothetical protein